MKELIAKYHALTQNELFQQIQDCKREIEAKLEQAAQFFERLKDDRGYRWNNDWYWYFDGEEIMVTLTHYEGDREDVYIWKKDLENWDEYIERLKRECEEREEGLKRREEEKIKNQDLAELARLKEKYPEKFKD